MSMSDIPHRLLDELPDVDRRSCRLLGPTALITQGLMGILVISSLIFKRHRESPKRPWRIWLFDVSKQVVGQLIVHGVNVLISGVVAHLSSGNACVFYFLNILVDTTIGVGVIYFVLQLLTWLLSEKCHFKGFESGQYGSPPSFLYWLRQATVYVFSLLAMKGLVIALFAAWPGIFKLGEWLLDFLGPSDALQVIFTMGLFPIMMNILQFWLIDSIVKSSQAAAVALPTTTPRSSLDAATEPLFRASLSSDDSDDDTLPARHDIENPRPRSLSRSPARQMPLDEPKSFSSGTATVTGSGSTTPMPKAIDIPPGAEALAMHAYPPSLVGSSSSSSSSSGGRHAGASPNISLLSSSTRTKSTSPRPTRRRRSPPPALALQPITPPATKAVNPIASARARTSISQRLGEAQRLSVEGQVLDEKEWAAWEDDGADDWADRVGEEEWTGRRMEARKEHVDNVWAQQGGIVDTGS